MQPAAVGGLSRGGGCLSGSELSKRPRFGRMAEQVQFLQRSGGSALGRPLVRRTCPGVALAETDGGAHGGSFMGEKASALPFASSRSFQAAAPYHFRESNLLGTAT